MSSTKISKVWALVYLCNNSKALHTEVVEDYSGAVLITALRQAFAVRNMPAQITTNPGRNFVKAKSLFSLDYADAKLGISTSCLEDPATRISLKCLPTKMLSLMS